MLISQNCVISFSDFFFMKLGDHKHSKVTELDFSGRFSFAQKGPKWPKMDCFDNFSLCSHNYVVNTKHYSKVINIYIIIMKG